MPQNEIYGLDVIPQFKGGIDANIAAASAPFEPIKTDLSLYQTMMNADLEREKLALAKDKLKYNKEVLDSQIEQYWNEQNANILGNLAEYTKAHISNAKKGNTLSTGTAMPYYVPIIQKYEKQAQEIYSKYGNTYEANKKLRELKSEMLSDKDFNESIQSGVNWGNTTQVINEVLQGKNKNLTKNNIDLKKYKVVTSKINNGEYVNPDDLLVTNYIVEDKNAIIKTAIEDNTKLIDKAEIEQINGKDYAKKVKVGDSPINMFEKIFDDLINNESLVSQLESNYKLDGVDSAKIPQLVEADIAKIALEGINQKFGTNAITPNELSNTPVMITNQYTGGGKSVAAEENLIQKKEDSQLRIEAEKQANRLEVQGVKNNVTKGSKGGKKTATEIKADRELNSKKNMLQNSLNVEKIDGVVTNDVAQQLVDAKIVSVNDVTVEQKTDDYIKLKINKEGEGVTVIVPTKKALDNNYVNKVKENKIIAKKGENDPQYLMEAAAFLRTPELQDAVYSKLVPIYKNIATKLRKYDKDNKYTDMQLMYIAHHSGFENGKKFLEGGESSSANKKDFKELEIALPKIKKAEESGKTEWGDIIKTKGIESSNGYDAVYKGDEPSTALGQYQILFDTNRELIRETAKEMGIVLGDSSYLSKREIKNILNNPEQNKESVLKAIKYYVNNYGGIDDLGLSENMKYNIDILLGKIDGVIDEDKVIEEYIKDVKGDSSQKNQETKDSTQTQDKGNKKDLKSKWGL